MKRKTTLLCMTILLLHEMVMAQKTEFSVNLNSGFYHFSGENASGQTYITLFPRPTPFIYNSPGKKSGFSYEFSLQGQRITRKKIIYGLDLAYQSFQSRTGITGVTPTIYSSALFIAQGSSRLTSTFIGIAPYAGYRLTGGQIVVDLKAGAEYAPCLKREQRINATVTGSGQEISNQQPVSNKRPDLRIRVQLTVMYKRFGINAGYSHGLNNYYEKDDFGHPQSFSGFIRLGLNYRIR